MEFQRTPCALLHPRRSQRIHYILALSEHGTGISKTHGAPSLIHSNSVTTGSMTKGDLLSDIAKMYMWWDSSLHQHNSHAEDLGDQPQMGWPHSWRHTGSNGKLSNSRGQANTQMLILQGHWSHTSWATRVLQRLWADIRRSHVSANHWHQRRVL